MGAGEALESKSEQDGRGLHSKLTLSLHSEDLPFLPLTGGWAFSSASIETDTLMTQPLCETLTQCQLL